MTREEAIQVLTDIKRIRSDEIAKAIDMAIEALSKPNYETDNEVRLAVTNREKEKVILWDSFGEIEYYPIEALQTAEINCVHCPHYYETEDDTDVHGHCRMDTVTLNSPISIQADMVSVVRCKDCRHHGMRDCPVWGDNTTEDYMWCYFGERGEK